MILHFSDLHAKRIVRTWTTLNKYVDEKGFPPGRIIAGHRTWTEKEVLAWIERQPTDKIELRGDVKRRQGRFTSDSPEAA